MSGEELARLEQLFLGRTITGIAYRLVGDGRSAIRFELDDGGFLEVAGALEIALSVPEATPPAEAPPAGDHVITPRPGGLAARAPR